MIATGGDDLRQLGAGSQGKTDHEKGQLMREVGPVGEQVARVAGIKRAQRDFREG